MFQAIHSFKSFQNEKMAFIRGLLTAQHVDDSRLKIQTYSSLETKAI